MLAVSQSSDLPGTIREINGLANHFGEMELTWKKEEHATVEAVLQEMETHSAVHFACHAYQNRDDPTQSAFKLHGSDLTLSRIMRQQFKRGEFAFLSACQTATGDDKLPDEAVHLAAGMLFAGYRTVIGTMWSIRDNYAPDVAEGVYSRIVDAQGRRLNSREAAVALHRAVSVLRGKLGEKAFETWVPFIHIGI